MVLRSRRIGRMHFSKFSSCMASGLPGIRVVVLGPVLRRTLRRSPREPQQNDHGNDENRYDQCAAADPMLDRAPTLAGQIADQDRAGRPNHSAEDVEKEKVGIAQSHSPGEEWHENAEDGRKPGEKNRLAAVPMEEVVD